MATLKTKINTFLRGEKTKRDSLQALLVECIDHAKANDNAFDLLSMLIRGLIEIKSRNTNSIREYIREHVTGITWTKSKDGQYLFKRVGRDVAVEYKDIEYPWYNHKGNMATNSNTEYSLARVKSLLTNMTKAFDDDNVKEEDKEKLEAIRGYLSDVLKA